MTEQINTNLQVEVEAITTVAKALEPLEPLARERVLNYVCGALSISLTSKLRSEERRQEVSKEDSPLPMDETHDETPFDMSGDSGHLEGISPVARKWMSRSGLSEEQLGSIFSLSLDEIDLVADKIPGNAKRQKMRSVFLLKGIASFLGSGTARFKADEIKQVCMHYGALDGKNYATYLKELADEVSQSNGEFKLTPKGMIAATNLIKEMQSNKK